MNQKIVSLTKYKNSKKQKNMFFLTIVIGVILGFLIWNYFVDNVALLDVEIPSSQNIVFNDKEPLALTSSQVANEFENADGKPILFYVYTTWCKVCTKNFPVINEIAREFQNTELRVIAIAVDKNMNAPHLQKHLNMFGELYFQPQYLGFKEGFMEFLQRKNIQYNNRIPFTVFIGRDGEVIAKYTGYKSKNYLRNKIIKEVIR